MIVGWIHVINHTPTCIFGWTWTIQNWFHGLRDQLTHHTDTHTHTPTHTWTHTWTHTNSSWEILIVGGICVIINAVYVVRWIWTIYNWWHGLRNRWRITQTLAYTQHPHTRTHTPQSHIYTHRKISSRMILIGGIICVIDHAPPYCSVNVDHSNLKAWTAAWSMTQMKIGSAMLLCAPQTLEHQDRHRARLCHWGAEHLLT
jgi:hypothetical protein